jgi:hypothetical protein
MTFRSVSQKQYEKRSARHAACTTTAVNCSYATKVTIYNCRNCYVGDLYDGQQMRPEKLDTWQALHERYGTRDESRVDRGGLLAPAA